MLNIPLSMKNLMELELHAICGRLTGKFLSNVKSLKKLTLNGIEVEGMIKCLVRNHQLKFLKLYENAFISYFKIDFTSKIKFQLEELTVYDHYNQDNLRMNNELPAVTWCKKCRNNFLKFLTSQNNLKALYLDFCNAKDIKKIILLLPMLKLLEINKLIGNFENIKIPKNSIKVFLTNSEDINFILKMFNNLNLDASFINRISKRNFLELMNHLNINHDFYYFWSFEHENENFVDLKQTHNCESVNITRLDKISFLQLCNN